MKALLTVTMLLLSGLVLTSCVSIPNEADDEQMWSGPRYGGLHDPDAMDDDR